MDLEDFSLGSRFNKSQASMSSRAHSTFHTAKGPRLITGTAAATKRDRKGMLRLLPGTTHLCPLYSVDKGRE